MAVDNDVHAVLVEQILQILLEEHNNAFGVLLRS